VIFDLDKRIKAILFDLGNTLIYFDGCWEEILEESYLSLADALIERKIYVERDLFAAVFKERMSQYFAERETTLIEKTAGNVLRSLLVELGFLDVGDENLRFALDSMYRITEARWRLEEDTIPTLKSLHQKGYRLGLVSNAADTRDVERLMEGFQLNDYFSEIIISASVGIRKPHPHIFYKALEGLGAAPQETMMVGDTLNADVLGANQMGIESVWITRRVDLSGQDNHREEIRPDHVIENLWELIGVLDKPVSF